MKVKIKIEDSVGTSLRNWIDEGMHLANELDPVGTAILIKMEEGKDWAVTLTDKEEVQYLIDQIEARESEVGDLLGYLCSCYEEFAPYNLEYHRLRRSAKRLKRILKEEEAAR